MSQRTLGVTFMRSAEDIATSGLSGWSNVITRSLNKNARGSESEGRRADLRSRAQSNVINHTAWEVQELKACGEVPGIWKMPPLLPEQVSVWSPSRIVLPTHFRLFKPQSCKIMNSVHLCHCLWWFVTAARRNQYCLPHTSLNLGWSFRLSVHVSSSGKGMSSAWTAGNSSKKCLCCIFTVSHAFPSQPLGSVRLLD